MKTYQNKHKNIKMERTSIFRNTFIGQSKAKLLEADQEDQLFKTSLKNIDQRMIQEKQYLWEREEAMQYNPNASNYICKNNKELRRYNTNSFTEVTNFEDKHCYYD